MNVRCASSSAALLMFAALALPTPATAVVGGAYTTVLSILSTSSALPAPATTGLVYGGCMVNIATPVKQFSNSPNCPGAWVSFSCDGTYASQSAALMLLDQAQMALALGKQVYIEVDDQKLHNTFCTATRIDIRQ